MSEGNFNNPGSVSPADQSFGRGLTVQQPGPGPLPGQGTGNGIAGPPGPQGVAGPPGPPGPANPYIESEDNEPVIVTSPDGITWTPRTGLFRRQWYGIAYGKGVFVAVAQSGIGDRAMSSGYPGIGP